MKSSPWFCLSSQICPHSSAAPAGGKAERERCYTARRAVKSRRPKPHDQLEGKVCSHVACREEDEVSGSKITFSRRQGQGEGSGSWLFRDRNYHTVENSIPFLPYCAPSVVGGLGVPGEAPTPMSGHPVEAKPSALELP